jgi:hypothetical protein
VAVAVASTPAYYKTATIVAVEKVFVMGALVNVIIIYGYQL